MYRLLGEDFYRSERGASAAGGGCFDGSLGVGVKARAATPLQPNRSRLSSRALGSPVGVAIVLVAANALSATALSGQTVTRLSPCTSCDMRVVPVVALGSAADPESPADRPHRDVVRDRRDRYFVRAGWPVTRILVYNSDGNLESVWGRGGDGPGEYNAIGQLLMLGEDSLAVLDISNLRLTVLDAEGSVARTRRLPLRPYPEQMARLNDGTLVVAGGEHTAASTGYLVHLVRPDGSVSPLLPAGMVLRSRPSAAKRRLAVVGTTFWAARPDRYELTEYAADGTALRVLKRDVAWFPDREIEGVVENAAKEPPYPFLRAIHVDEDGFIWTMVRLVDAEWAPVEEVGSLSREQRYDSIVEVIDPDRGVVVRSQRFPWQGDGFTNDGLIVSQRTDALGVVVLNIWRPERVTDGRP